MPTCLIGILNKHTLMIPLEKCGEFDEFLVIAAEQCRGMRGWCVDALRFELNTQSVEFWSENARLGSLVRTSEALLVQCRVFNGSRHLVQIANLSRPSKAGIQAFFPSWKAVKGDGNESVVVFNRK